VGCGRRHMRYSTLTGPGDVEGTMPPTS
jgi:hypothetical protein